MKWYVVHTKARHEERAKQELTNQGFEVFLPQILAQKKTRKTVEEELEPLFPRYLFIHLNYAQDDTYTIRSTRGVAKGLLCFGDNPAHIPDEIILEIQNMCQSTLDNPRPLFRQGDTLVIKEGPFKGLMGELEKIHTAQNGEVRVMILIELLGKLQRLPFTATQVGLA